VKRGEVVLQQPVDKNVAATDLPEENALAGIVQEFHIMPRGNAVTDE